MKSRPNPLPRDGIHAWPLTLDSCAVLAVVAEYMYNKI